MRRLAISLGALVIVSGAFAGGTPDNIYRNMLAIPGSFFASGNEYGDKVTLDTGSRNLTSFTLAYVADLTTGQNDETVQVRIYDATGTGGGPGTMLWQSTDMPIRDGLWSKTIVISGGLTVPDDIIYTVEFKNMDMIAGDRAGLVLSDPPTRGSSTNDFWMFDMGAWGEFEFTGGVPVANFQASFWVDGVAPQPYQNEIVPPEDWDFYFPGFHEFGDQIDLEGTKRKISAIRFPIYCPELAAPGDEELVVRIWKLDGVDQVPGTMLWESAPMPFVADPANVQFFDVSVPNVTVEDAIVWTVEFRGVAQTSPPNPTDNAGLLMTGKYDSATQVITDFEPQLGSSRDFFVGRNVPSQTEEWTFWVFRTAMQPLGPQANFEVAFDGVGTEKLVPTAFGLLTGVQTAGNLQSLISLDNDRLFVREAPPLALGLPSVAVNVDTVSPTLNPSALTIKVVMNTSGAPAGAVQFRVLGVLGNNTTELLSTTAGTSTDQTITITPTGDLSRFVQSGSNRLRVRLQMFDPGTLFNFGWSARINQVSWEIE